MLTAFSATASRCSARSTPARAATCSRTPSRTSSCAASAPPRAASPRWTRAPPTRCSPRRAGRRDAHRTRTRGPQARRRGPAEQADRPRAGDHGEDREGAHDQDLRRDRRDRPHRGRPVGPPQRRPLASRTVAERFAIAQVAPHPLEDANEVGTFAAEVSRELAERGHRVLLLAPSRSPGARARVAQADPGGARDAGGRCSIPTAACGCWASASCCSTRRRKGINPRRRSTSRARSRRCSASRRWTSCTCTSRGRRAPGSVALRHSRALNVGSFHAPAERVLSHAGRAQVRGAVLRPPGRPHGELRGHGGAAAALLPRRPTSCCARA